jgi:hypothetical protein
VELGHNRLSERGLLLHVRRGRVALVVLVGTDIPPQDALAVVVLEEDGTLGLGLGRGWSVPAVLAVGEEGRRLVVDARVLAADGGQRGVDARVDVVVDELAVIVLALVVLGVIFRVVELVAVLFLDWGGTLEGGCFRGGHRPRLTPLALLALLVVLEPLGVVLVDLELDAAGGAGVAVRVRVLEEALLRDRHGGEKCVCMGGAWPWGKGGRSGESLGAC